MRSLLLTVATAAALFLAVTYSARADDGDQLDRIPSPAPSASASPAPRGGHTSRIFLENAGSLEAIRGNLAVPFPPPSLPNWENRTSLDSRQEWTEGHDHFTLSNRLNITEASAFAFTSNQTFRDDLREAFVSLDSNGGGFLEAGRINVHNGVALGVNPTDFFKTRTLVDQSSLDPTVIRNDRLGVTGVSYERLDDRGSVRLFYAPKLAPPSALSYTPQSGFNPRLDETNSDNRFELSLSRKLSDLEPQAIIYVDGSQLRYGLNISHQASNSLVLYAEVAGGAQSDLVARALSYGERTDTFTGAVKSVLPNNDAVGFKGDASLGASWTSVKNLNVDVEYEYHQAGLSRADWKNWIDLGTADSANADATGELWYIRAYANAEQEPLVQQQMFIRIDQQDAFIPHLELTAFAFVNLYDASLLSQFSTTYDFNDRWSAAIYFNGAAGGVNSERGSLPQARGVTAQVTRYF